MRRQYPKHFAKWLYAYCLKHSDIERCWLALASVGVVQQPDCNLLLKGNRVEEHLDHIKKEGAALLPNGMMLMSADWLPGIEKQDIETKMRQIPALYLKTHGQHVFARMLRALKRDPILHFSVTIDDVEAASS